MFANVKHMVRFKIVAFLGTVAFLLISLASYEGSIGKEEYFYVAVFASVLVGMS